MEKTIKELLPQVAEVKEESDIEKVNPLLKTGWIIIDIYIKDNKPILVLGRLT